LGVFFFFFFYWGGGGGGGAPGILKFAPEWTHDLKVNQFDEC